MDYKLLFTLSIINVSIIIIVVFALSVDQVPVYRDVEVWNIYFAKELELVRTVDLVTLEHGLCGFTHHYVARLAIRLHFICNEHISAVYIIPDNVRPNNPTNDGTL